MVQAVFCTASSGAEVEEAVARINDAGIKTNGVTIISQVPELEAAACPSTQINRSIKTGALWGFFIGWAIGLALLLYVPVLMDSPGALSLPAFTALGWVLFGSIVGSGGLLAKPGLPSKLLPHLEEALSEGRILLSLEVATSKELESAAQTLLTMKESDMHRIDAVAA
jgi:hypothetical protein